MDQIAPLLETREVQRAYKDSSSVPPRADNEKPPTGFSPEIVGLLHHYDTYRHEGFEAEHPSYRKLIEAIKDFRQWADPIRKTNQALEKKFKEEVGKRLAQIEQRICDLVASNRGFLEDPIILGYYRASAVYRNDGFFSKLGQALKKRTAPHARSKEEEAEWLRAQEEAGVPFEKRVRLDGKTAKPEADRKLLKRYPDPLLREQ
jgi:hypothetical protein